MSNGWYRLQAGGVSPPCLKPGALTPHFWKYLLAIKKLALFFPQGAATLP